MIVFLKRMAAIERAAVLLASLQSSLTRLFTKRICARLVGHWSVKFLPGLHVCTTECYSQRLSGSSYLRLVKGSHSLTDLLGFLEEVGEVWERIHFTEIAF